MSYYEIPASEIKHASSPTEVLMKLSIGSVPYALASEALDEITQDHDLVGHMCSFIAFTEIRKAHDDNTLDPPLTARQVTDIDSVMSLYADVSHKIIEGRKPPSYKVVRHHDRRDARPVLEALVAHGRPPEHPYGLIQALLNSRSKSTAA